MRNLLRHRMLAMLDIAEHLEKRIAAPTDGESVPSPDSRLALRSKRSIKLEASNIASTD